MRIAYLTIYFLVEADPIVVPMKKLKKNGVVSLVL